MKPTQKKKGGARVMKKVSPFLVAVVGLSLAGGAFAFAAGDMLGNGSLLAAVMSAVTNGSTVNMTRTATSPQGTILGQKNTAVPQTLAVFNLTSQHEKWWNTVTTATVKVTASGNGAAQFGVDGIGLNYNYCLAANTTYGYGWKTPAGRTSCASMGLPVQKVTRSGNTFMVTFNTGGSTGFPVYPQQMFGYLSVVGVPAYAKAAPDVKMGTAVTLGARGSACRTITYGLVKNGKTVNYGYTKCDPVAAYITGTTIGNNLTIKNPYGYTSTTAVRPVCGLFRGGTSQAKNMIASPNPASSVADTDSACISYCTASGAKTGDMCMRGTNIIKTYGAPADSFVVNQVSATANVAVNPYGADTGIYTISFQVTAGNSDVYIGRTTTHLANASSTPTAVGGGTAWTVTPTSSANIVNTGVSNLSATGSNTGDTASAYKVSAGYSRNFILNTAISAKSNGYTGVVLKGINYSNTSTLGSLYYTNGLMSFKTPDVYLGVHTATSTGSTTAARR